jgi:hypothetical protein
LISDLAYPVLLLVKHFSQLSISTKSNFTLPPTLYFLFGKKKKTFKYFKWLKALRNPHAPGGLAARRTSGNLGEGGLTLSRS